jgi:hypothetical protein
MTAREPEDEKRLSGKLGGIPNFMIRKWRYKLILPKNAKTDVEFYIMYDLEVDPYEMDNLVGSAGMSATDEIIGKAEHLKTLLLDWT